MNWGATILTILQKCGINHFMNGVFQSRKNSIPQANDDDEKGEKKMALQIKKESPPNSNVIPFYTTAEISQFQLHTFYRPLRDTSEQYLKDVGGKGAELIRKVMAIPGINTVSISPYKLSLIRSSSLFKWEDIEPIAEKAIKAVFGGEREEVKYLSLAEIPITVILSEPWKRLGWLIRKAWHRITNLV